MKAILFARVSSKEQEEGHSIAAQMQRLREYCVRRQFNIIRTFELVESSTRGERKEFTAMLHFAKQQGEVVAIVADAVDRVQRGWKESLILDELIRQSVIELHFVREGMILGKNASASDLLRWDFSVVGARSYVLNLSENVKRSLQYKLKNGEWTGPAPIGYINVRDPETNKASLTKDFARAPLVTRIFQEYASGAFSINELAKRAKEWGLRNKTSGKTVLSPSQIHHVLCNPFYSGKMRINGQLYPHRYEPLITSDLFHACEIIRLGRGRKNAVKQTNHPFIFRGLITCAVSGRKVTCDLKKGRYVYLICRNPANPEEKIFVSEKIVLEQIKSVFHSIQLPQPLVEALSDHLQQSHEAEIVYHSNAIAALEKENQEFQIKQDRLLDLLISKSITQDTYDTKQQKFKQRQYEIHQELGAHHSADDSFRITVSSLLSLASRAYDLFMSSENEKKRQLINFMFSNLRLNGGKLEYALRPPFHLMTKTHSYEEWLPILNTIRTEYYKDVLALAVIVPKLKTSSNFPCTT